MRSLVRFDRFPFLMYVVVLMLSQISAFAQNTNQSQSKKDTSYFAYASAEEPRNEIYGYRMLANGQLLPLSPQPAATVDSLSLLAANPHGGYLYAVAGKLGNTIKTYRIESNGALSLLPYRTSSNGRIEDMKFSPDGHFMYAVQSEIDTITEYKAGFDGQLSVIASIHTGPNPISLTLDQSGQFAYLLCLNRGEPLGYAAFVSEYHLITGFLSPLKSAPEVSGIRIDVQGKTGNIVYAPIQHVVCVSTYYGIATYAINQDGVLSVTSHLQFDSNAARSLTLSNPTGLYLVSIGEPKNKVFIDKLQPPKKFSLTQELFFQKNGSLTTEPADPGMYDTTIVAICFSPDGRFLYFVDPVNSRIIEFSAGIAGKLNMLPLSIIPTTNPCSNLIIVPASITI